MRLNMNEIEHEKSKSRGVSRDMSPRAISRRFDILVELDRLSGELQNARRKEEQTPEQKITGRGKRHPQI